MTRRVKSRIFFSFLALAGYGSMPDSIQAQEIPADPVIEEPIRTLFSGDDSEVGIPSVGGGCGQLSLAPLLFGWPALVMMSIYSTKCSRQKRISA